MTCDGVSGYTLNEEIRRKASGEGGSSTNMVRGRTIREVIMHTGTKVKARKGEIATKVKEMIEHAINVVGKATRNLIAAITKQN